MKIYKSDDKEVKWFKKINWINLIIVTILVFIPVSFILNHFGKELERAIMTGSLITLLIDIGVVLKDLFGNRTIILMVENNKVKYIDQQRDRSGTIIPINSYENIIKKNNPEDIYKNIETYEGIVCGVVNKVNRIKKRSNCFIINVEVNEKKWKPTGKITLGKLELTEKRYNKKIKITNDFQNYKGLYSLFEKNYKK